MQFLYTIKIVMDVAQIFIKIMDTTDLLDYIRSVRELVFIVDKDWFFVSFS